MNNMNDSSTNDTITHALSVEDAGVGASTNIFGYILQGSCGPTDAELEGALAGVVDKWRVLSGRLEKVEEVSEPALSDSSHEREVAY